jgi:hypothetical protein
MEVLPTDLQTEVLKFVQVLNHSALVQEINDTVNLTLDIDTSLFSLLPLVQVQYVLVDYYPFFIAKYIVPRKPDYTPQMIDTRVGKFGLFTGDIVFE